jgi:hypothetical protein
MAGNAVGLLRLGASRRQIRQICSFSQITLILDTLGELSIGYAQESLRHETAKPR